MTLVAGAKLGLYEVVSPLGAGGMGEVYRAKDTRLDRDMAIKVLPEALARDKERVLRFEREAKLPASPEPAEDRRFERTAMFPPLCVIVLLCSLLMVGCASTRPRLPAGADFSPAEEAAVLDAVDRVLVAMGARDAAAYADSLTSDGMTYSQRWMDGQWRLRRRTNQHHIDTLNDEASVLTETYWEPTVLIRGPIAVVWASYEFRIDGEVSHCGVDCFEMLKIDGRWIMGNAMWTVEPEACHELRPRRGATIRPAESTNP
jgi:hypothetical protein